MIAEGRYKVRGVEGALVAVGQNHTEAVQVIVEIVQEGPNKGERYRWDGWLTDKAAQRTLESLRHLGWATDRLDDLAGIDGKEAIAVIAHETNEKDGKVYARVQWINGVGAGIKDEARVGGVAAKALADRFSAMARGTRAAGATTAVMARGAPPKATPPKGAAPDFSDDDIPF